jgi:hypothetical protein
MTQGVPVVTERASVQARSRVACPPLEHRKGGKDMTVRRRFRWILFWLQMVPARSAVSLCAFSPVDADEVTGRLDRNALGQPSGLVPDIAGPRVYGTADPPQFCDTKTANRGVEERSTPRRPLVAALSQRPGHRCLMSDQLPRTGVGPPSPLPLQDESRLQLRGETS